MGRYCVSYTFCTHDTGSWVTNGLKSVVGIWVDATDLISISISIAAHGNQRIEIRC